MTAPTRPTPPPALPSAGRASPNGQPSTRVLTVVVVLLFCFPARLVFSPLGAAGAPAEMFALAALVWWAAGRISAPRHAAARRPVKLAVLGFLLALGLSYIAANTRAIAAVEQRSADRGLLTICSWLGMFLIASGGVTTSTELDRVLRRLVDAAGLVAGMALLQFSTGFDIARHLNIPGLSADATFTTVYERSGFRRPSATATTPIELGVILAVALPLAVHFALASPTERRRPWLRWLPVVAIGAAIPVSVSRSGILGVAIACALVLPTWDRRMRRRGYACIAGFVATLWLTVPGLLGVFRSLFTGISQDGSAQSRTDSYSYAWTFVERAPVIGRGFSTFLPSYRIIDNQYLGTIIEAGFVGLVCLLGMFVVGMVIAERIRRSSIDPVTRSLARSLTAAIAILGASCATFDTFGFAISAGLTFLFLGFTDALWRLHCSAGLVVPLPLDGTVGVPPQATNTGPDPALTTR